MEKKTYDQYVRLVYFLGNALGPNYEIVLHIIDKEQSYIAAIANNHISGRTEKSPLTGFALELIKNKEYLNSDYATNYKVKVKRGSCIQGSTFFIKDDLDNLEGMLCINADYTKHKNIASDILQLMNVENNNATPQNQSPLLSEDSPHDNGDEFVEVLSSNIEDIIFDIIGPSIKDENFLLNQEAKIHIVDQLEKKGIFQLKGAVSQVAEILSVSEPSVYRYLKIVTKNNQV